MTDLESQAVLDACRRAMGALSSADDWFEEIQHAGYAVPAGRESEFAEFWASLAEIESEFGRAIDSLRDLHFARHGVE